MNITISLTQQDWVFFNKYVQRQKQKETKGFTDSFFGNLIVYLILGLVVVFFLDGYFHWKTAASTCFILGMIVLQYFLNLNKLQKALMPTDIGVFVGHHQFEFKDNGISSSGNGYTSFHEWSTVKEIVIEEDYLMIFLDTVNAFILPTKQIDNIDLLKKILNKNKA